MTAERLDISDRDPDTLTDREKLAAAYPEVYALIRQHAEIGEMWRAVRMVDGATAATPFRDQWPGLAAALDRLVDQT